ncbi:hypothetical protein [Halobacterium zhouii]|uniref:hypothetical protein n=1 Tax=Halobacterium zhouii TaxID=2902624 RepID=UPI001E5925D5|nr:hypothetical protein [Halobacterium zhouii]
MTDYEGAKTMLVGVQLTLLALFLPRWIPSAFAFVMVVLGTALVLGGYAFD